MEIDEETHPNFKLPSTRYQGSKRKLAPWIYHNIIKLEFDTVLDVFGGTGVISYLLKRMGKSVTYNDYMKFNSIKGKALIENSSVILSDDDMDFLLEKQNRPNNTFITDTFANKYYIDAENAWLDNFVDRISLLNEKYSGQNLEYKQSIAFYALFESCLMKRPFNTFHRANLNLRTNDVKRSFGNKTTWDKPFDLLFRKFVNEINGFVFSNGKINKSLNKDALSLNDDDYGLVYLDPPYFSLKRNDSGSNYSNTYHFLEGLANYEKWPELIDYNSFNLRLRRNGNTWLDKNKVLSNLEQLFNTFDKSIIVLSYKSPGIPSENEITTLLKKYKKNVLMEKEKYNYALKKFNVDAAENNELLIIGT
jgi:adenine-specific DNA methylase